MKILIILLLCAALGACEKGHYGTVVHHYTVLDKMYQPDTRSTAVDPIISMRGKVHIAVVSTGHAEAFVLLVREGSGNTHTIKVGPEIYSRLVVGSIFQMQETEWIADAKPAGSW